MKTVPFWVAISPVIFLIGILAFNLSIFGDEGLNGSNQIVLLLTASLASAIGLLYGVRWKVIQEGILQNIMAAMPAIIILLLIGSLSGAWMLGGIVPAMIYYGLQILHPFIFLPACAIISAVVSLSTGSSWSTVATVGVALIGIGKALQMPDPLTAGAIISGAYFGDKLSPLSDTTNLAPAVAGTELFKHVQYMMLTTIPTFAITLLIFTAIGLYCSFATSYTFSHADSLTYVLENTFTIHWSLLIVPLGTFYLVARRIPAIPAMFIGILGGVICTFTFQSELIMKLSHQTFSLRIFYEYVLKALYGKIQIPVHHPILSELLVSRGMAGMLNTVWLIISAMIFGGAMEASGLLPAIVSRLSRLANSDGSLVLTTSLTAILMNLTTADQYLSVAITGRMFKNVYLLRNLAPENLSRTVEDSGTVTSVLIPWNTCGATQSTVLGVSTWSYAPYCFFCYLSPFMTVLFAYLQIKIKRLE
ncbi:MAG: Na+/H+ antiporter NhaC [Cytophagales bacterium]|nr:Na+/H+ antiporter NhaC [Cytophagales bacterium]MDW8385050.1 Na+/H+ antiporter NhaC [Flammeovirgaceae bacterium]